MNINDLKNRLRRDRPMKTITVRIPEDVLEDLKRMAPRLGFSGYQPVSYTHLRAHETVLDLVCRLLLEKKKNTHKKTKNKKKKKKEKTQQHKNTARVYQRSICLHQSNSESKPPMNLS